jgi:hypothetical protein
VTLLERRGDLGSDVGVLLGDVDVISPPLTPSISLRWNTSTSLSIARARSSTWSTALAEFSEPSTASRIFLNICAPLH